MRLYAEKLNYATLPDMWVTTKPNIRLMSVTLEEHHPLCEIIRVIPWILNELMKKQWIVHYETNTVTSPRSILMIKGLPYRIVSLYQQFRYLFNFIFLSFFMKFCLFRCTTDNHNWIRRNCFWCIYLPLKTHSFFLLLFHS